MLFYGNIEQGRNMLGAVYILEKRGRGFYKVIEKVVNEFVNDSDLENLTTSLANDVFAKNGAIGKVEPTNEFFMSGSVEIDGKKFKTRKVKTYRVKINHSKLTKDAEFFVESVILSENGQVA
ncbi:hypothetical protein TMA_037 [Thermus phage TMA]|uniref:hypothetical protein n=1 Tax=Thermus phage TMA TaxID=699370 RepID=UPI00021AAE37|nr:hypothetical protein TMA_037 [Thermus phage TMA]BAK53725.1 hypothetical protein TMA_037 [Thermus phage TMA]